MLLVGTATGLFTFESDEGRRRWRKTGPLLSGWEVTGLLGDGRGGGRILAGTCRDADGATIQVSDDLCRTWTPARQSPRYGPGSGRVVRRVWQIAPWRGRDAYLAGVDEAGLFVSMDGGASWRQRDTLGRHPSRPRWSPTAAGNPLHSIVLNRDDPQRMWAVVGGAGVVYSGDGGVEWTFRNSGLPPIEGSPDLTQGVHRVVADPAVPERLYLQSTDGTFASGDGGGRWEGMNAGLPSAFGFALAVTAAGDLYTVPLDRGTRCFPDGRAPVYRRGRDDSTWRPTGGRLPEEPRRAGVLRDALAIDDLEPPGVYFGTTRGEVFASPDGGAEWMRVAGELPRVQTVRVWRVE